VHLVFFFSFTFSLSIFSFAGLGIETILLLGHEEEHANSRWPSKEFTYQESNSNHVAVLAR
jgi:hypothetical protein